jgi:hypothetical protein
MDLIGNDVIIKNEYIIIAWQYISGREKNELGDLRIKLKTGPVG